MAVAGVDGRGTLRAGARAVGSLVAVRDDDEDERARWARCFIMKERWDDL